MDEQTFVMIKPDGVQRGLVAEIMARFERRGYKLVALKMVSPSESLVDEHYADLREKPFFAGLRAYILSGPVVATVWQGKCATSVGRAIVGATNPRDSAPGTVRGDYCIDVGRNVVHASDSVDAANREIKLWFKDGEVQSYQSCAEAWVYE